MSSSSNVTEVRPRYLAIGHVTRDVAPDGTERLGGSVTYAGVTAERLGMRAAIVSRSAPAVIDAGELGGVACHIRAARRTTTFVNDYKDGGKRSQRLITAAPRVRAADIPAGWREVEICHLAPVVHEIGSDIVAAIPMKAFVGVTAQGWQRELELGAVVRARPWSVPRAIAERADAVVVSTEDLAAEPRDAPTLARRVRLLVVTDGANGATAYSGGRVVHQAALAARAVDPTGAGDVLAAAFFIRLRETGDVAEALRFGAAAAACAIEAPGVAGIATRGVIEERLRRAWTV